MSILIVGGDSQLGGALRLSYAAAGQLVLATSRRPQAAEKSMYLDLAEDLSSWQPPSDLRLVYLLAAVTSIDACYRGPERTHRVNVEGICQVARLAARQGAFVLFVSTNYVFDGESPFMPADSPCSPRTEYGRQKAEAEARLLEQVPDLAIVRLSKVLGPQVALAQAWLNSLRAGQEIKPFLDMSLAPVPLFSVISILRLVGDLRFKGIVQASGEKDVSYVQWATMAAKLVGADPALIKPIVARESGLIAEQVPNHTTLDTRVLRKELGIFLPPVEWTLDKALSSPQALAGVGQALVRRWERQ